MSRLLFLLICYNFLNLNLGEYEAPKSAQFPFGDEVFNADISEDRVQEEAREVSIEIIKDISLFCPNKTEDDEHRMLEEIPYCDNECSRCDVRPTVDKRGVLVECYNCSDVSVMMLAAVEEKLPSHVLFLTTYLEVANYSAPWDPDM